MVEYVQRSLEQVWYVVEDVSTWGAWWGDGFGFRSEPHEGRISITWGNGRDQHEVQFETIGVVRERASGKIGAPSIAHFEFSRVNGQLTTATVYSECAPEKYDRILLSLKKRVESLFPVADPAQSAGASDQDVGQPPRASASPLHESAADLPPDGAEDVRREELLEAVRRHSVPSSVEIQPMRSKIEGLMGIVRENKSWLVWDGDRELNRVETNLRQRVRAAEELAEMKAIEALPVLEDLFVEQIHRLNYNHHLNDFFQVWQWHSWCVLSLAKAILTLGGTNAFSTMVTTKAIPSLENADCLDTQAKVLMVLQRAFGGIGECDRVISMRLADLRVEESRQRAERWRAYVRHLKEREVRQLAKLKEFELQKLAREKQLEKQRLEEESQRLAETCQRLYVQSKRKSERRCAICGTPLDLVSRILKHEQHSRCLGCSFKEGPDRDIAVK